MTKLEAFKILLDIDQETVIHDGWWDYFEHDATHLIALLTLCDTMSFIDINRIYEGYTIKEFLQDRIK